MDIVYPVFEDGSILEGTLPIPEHSKKRMEGVYTLSAGNEFFGDVVVVKWSDENLLSIFCEKNSAYLILEGGVKDSSLFSLYFILMEGEKDLRFLK